MLLPPRADLTEGVGGRQGEEEPGWGQAVTAFFVLQEDSSPYERINPRVPFKQNVPRILKEDSIYKNFSAPQLLGEAGASHGLEIVF